ncbi:oligopeptide/dipeptide ABC transporter ATP-binding protein [Vibrio sp. CK2-1]|uniref:ABC transporter ATP-binding protein n=1 Tax=Vibrio sp. CK2-1 TaxID=2912249 RepID=UPI001F02256A|nr:oligopeptide/dipeptide ABC transporter ATP-binding protein [Vibrio sp. CK2-1]MCF7354270.1 ATP-binding cassette domain-containing protein [Vibrio sp. CK2-1]
MSELVRIKNLKQYFHSAKGLLKKGYTVHAVDDVSLVVNKGETLGIVGESGCGKSTLGRSLLRLYEPTSGQILFEGQDICQLDNKAMRSLRQEMQMVFQDPTESLNPRHTVGMILQEPFVIHKLGSEAERKKWVSELLVKVGLTPDAAERYPHEFSGGQKQRIGIARAIALKPKLVVCDESVSALDVSVQAQILNLLLELQKEMDLTLIFIAHDLSVIRHISDKIAVMYLGQIVEYGEAQQVYQHPKHPYTQSLLSAIPITHPKYRNAKLRLEEQGIGERILLKGDIPSPIDRPQGCRFASRCPKVMSKCQQQPVLMEDKNSHHSVSCFLYN